jgi:thiamine-monophosphate kinase
MTGTVERPGDTGTAARIAMGPGGEFDRIRRFLSEARSTDPATVSVGPGDDCAVLRAAPVAVSVDLSIEDVHFRRQWLPTPDLIGVRAAAVALSDLAASAAVPLGVLASLAMTADDAAAIGDAIMEGVREAIEAVGGALLGGDLTRSPGPLILDIVALGRADRPVLRGGAGPGDALWVTGWLGGAASAVHDWLEARTPAPDAVAAFCRPPSRIAEALWLAEHGLPRAMIDLSDGLAGDAGHLAAASGVRIIVDASALPLHPAAEARGPDGALAMALGGGEDYELCFASPDSAVGPLRQAFENTFGIPLTRVGEIVEGSGVVMRDNDGRLRGMPAAGFDHFARESR